MANNWTEQWREKKGLSTAELEALHVWKLEQELKEFHADQKKQVEKQKSDQWLIDYTARTKARAEEIHARGWPDHGCWSVSWIVGGAIGSIGLVFLTVGMSAMTRNVWIGLLLGATTIMIGLGALAMLGAYPSRYTWGESKGEDEWLTRAIERYLLSCRRRRETGTIEFVETVNKS